MPLSTLLANFVLFQAAWLCGVLGAAHGRPWLGPVVALVAVAWHLARARRALPEALLLAAALALGAAFENLLVLGGWLRFETAGVVAASAPAWMIALWAVFATTLNVSLRVLHRRHAAAAVLGAVAAPLAYYAGGRLGAVEFVNLGTALVVIGAGWVVLTPVLVSLAARLDGYVAR